MVEVDRQYEEQKHQETQMSGKAIDAADARRTEELSKTEEGKAILANERKENTIEEEWKAYVEEMKAAGQKPIPKKAFVNQKREQL